MNFFKKIKNIFTATKPTVPLKKGAAAERQALDYLQQQGLKHLQSNFAVHRGRSGLSGEIDIIMKDQSTLVFIEVRERSSNQRGWAIETISYHKQQKLIRTAQIYLQQHRARYHTPPTCRFDVISIDDGQLRWDKNAFEMR